MFGIGRKQDQDNVQIPYEVYETVQEPINRRRRWVVRLAAALVVVTLLIFGGNALRNVLSDDKPGSTGNQSQGAGNSGTANKDVMATESVNQAPQQNPAPAANGETPATVPQSSVDNNATVRRPE